MKKRLYGMIKDFRYSPDTKDEDIREKLIELIKEMDFSVAIPDWNTLQVIFHDYLFGIDPCGTSSLAIKYESTKYRE